MLGQIFDSGKTRAYLFGKTGNTKMPTFRDTICMKGKPIFTHIIPQDLNWDS